MKRRGWLLVAGIAVLAVVAGGLFWYLKQRDSGYKTSRLTLGQTTLRVQVADTPAKQELGLGKRNKLPAKTGMLFVYDHPQELCFWMKDMRIPLDMVWLDANRKIIQIQPRVTPASYPKTYCAEQAKYVLEINAGQAAALGLRPGQQAEF